MNIPEEYRPISSWGYIGYQILYNLPLIGFIILIINAIGARNINVRNHARSYFCVFLLVLIILVIIFILAMIFGVSLPSIKDFDFNVG